MRLVIQRTTNARLSVDAEVVAEIGGGLMILVGIEHDDNDEDVSWLASKTAKMRIFDDNDGVMNLSVADIGGEILAVSQFTLHASTKKGNRPSYIRAAAPDRAIQLYDNFVVMLEKESGCVVKKGVFGAHMVIDFTNDGPVTIIIDSKNRE